MSTRMRNVIGRATPLPSRTPRLRQNSAVRCRRVTTRSSGSRASPPKIQARTPARRSNSQAANIVNAAEASMISICVRTNFDSPNSAATIGSSLAWKSSSTAANCGSTNNRKKPSTAVAAHSTNNG